MDIAGSLERGTFVLLDLHPVGGPLALEAQTKPSSLRSRPGEEPPNEQADYATFTSKYESLFKEFDSDGDDGLSMEELGSAVEKDLTDRQKSLSPEGLRAEVEDLHSVVDRDRDGSFTLDELTDFFIKAAEELSELHDKRFPDKSNEQPVSDLNESEDDDHSN